MIKLLKKKQKQLKIKKKKQIDALEALKPKEIKSKEVKPIEYDNYFINGLAEIRKFTKPIDFNNLIYRFKGPNTTSINFIEFKGPLHIFRSIHNGDKFLEDVEKYQIKLKSELSRIR